MKSIVVYDASYGNTKKIADIIAERLDKRFPRLKDQIEAVDVVTPISVERWTAAYRGLHPKILLKKFSRMALVRRFRDSRNFIWLGNGQALRIL
jgi:phytoene dehydrogenase-like protein